MTAPASHTDTNRGISSAVVRTILIAGLVAGIFDISDAIIWTFIRGGSLVKLGQYIASGAMGAGAFDGGVATCALGYLIHFIIAYSAATTYVLVSVKWPALLRRPLVTGPLFGLGLYLFMNGIALPLSQVPPAKYTVISVVNLLFAHMILIGLSLSLITARRLSPSIAHK
jgi:hypothetical protein